MSANGRVYQIRIALQDIRPAIWRRVQVEGSTTLAQLHGVIQAAMGWEDYHLWRFQAGGVEYGPPDEENIGWELEMEDATAVRLADVAQAGDTLLYEYDFGDSWHHRIRVEKELDAAPGTAYPVCIAAERACPPEDCGGVWGYEQLLEALADAAHPEYDEMLAWVGGRFDPEEADLAEINRRLAGAELDYGSEGAPLGLAGSVLGMIHSQAEQLMEQVLSADPAATLDELNAALGALVTGHNLRAQSDFGGLSPMQVQRLLGAEWNTPGSAVQLDTTLAPGELTDSSTLHNARLLLELLGAQGEARATPKGNLPRAFVAAFHERMRWPVFHRSEWHSERKVLNEDDVWPLRLTRVLLELAGLMKRRKGKHSLTRAGERLAAPERTGDLFATLFLTHFRRLNLAYLDRAESVPDFQHTIAFTLYRFGQLGAAPGTPEALASELVLPAVRDNTPVSRFGRDTLPLILETRVLRPLEGFGLAEAHELPRAPGEWGTTRTYEKTPLFDRLVRFDLEPRARAVR